MQVNMKKQHRVINELQLKVNEPQFKFLSMERKFRAFVGGYG